MKIKYFCVNLHPQKNNIMVDIQAKKVDSVDISVEEKLRALYELQHVDSEIDKIRSLKGDLPLEAQDLEDEIAGLETRIKNIEDEVKHFETQASNHRVKIKECEQQIKKYETQQMKVRNNREYDSLTKEIEYQRLEIQLCEKRIREFGDQASEKRHQLDKAKNNLKERQADLEVKKNELKLIIAETQRDEDVLLQKSLQLEKGIEPRLLAAYKRIRGNARNGLAVVTVQRDACGGCYNKIPPQRQLDVASRKKVIVCEYCGRILIDNELATFINNSFTPTNF